MVLHSTWKQQVSPKRQIYFLQDCMTTCPIKLSLSRTMLIIGITSLGTFFFAIKYPQMNNWRRRLGHRWGESWRILVVSKWWDSALKPAVNSSTSLISHMWGTFLVFRETFSYYITQHPWRWCVFCAVSHKVYVYPRNGWNYCQIAR